MVLLLVAEQGWREQTENLVSLLWQEEDVFPPRSRAFPPCRSWSAASTLACLPRLSPATAAGLTSPLPAPFTSSCLLAAPHMAPVKYIPLRSCHLFSVSRQAAQKHKCPAALRRQPWPQCRQCGGPGCVEVWQRSSPEVTEW